MRDSYKIKFQPKAVSLLKYSKPSVTNIPYLKENSNTVYTIVLCILMDCKYSFKNATSFFYVLFPFEK